MASSTNQGNASPTAVPEFSPRPYQVEILQKAKKENTVVCLGTGTGKTFISVMLIKEKQDGINKTLEGNGKRTLFIVNTVPLVYQQAQVIKDHTALKVGLYTGDMGVDFWNAQRWKDEFNNNDVLVMTAQILYNILTSSFFQIRNINLLVLDECHNASGRHPYSMILKMFEDTPNQHHPHVMGLTASIINQKYTGVQSEVMIKTFLERKMKDLEGRMRAACVTCCDFDATVRYATKPEEIVESYEKGYDINDFNEVHNVINRVKDMLETEGGKFKQQRLSSKVSRTDAFMHLDFDDLLNNSMIFRIKGACEVACDTLKYCESLLDTLGLLCTYEAAKILLQQIDKHKRKRFKITEQKVFTECSQILSSIIAQFENVVRKTGFGVVENVLPMEPFITKKAHVFLKDILLKEKINYENIGVDLHAIVFVQRRCTAVILSQLINRQVQADYDNFNGLMSEYVLGHGLDANVRLADSFMKSKEQNKILVRFKKAEFNVLVATSVVEEGLDVRKCNLVVRFDGLFNYREYVQSKGRARAEKSKFIVMALAEEVSEKKKSLKVMQTIEKVLFEKCQTRRQPTEQEIEHAQFDEIEELIPTYYVPSGACITHATAVAMLHRYCGLLPHDEYVSMNPIFNEINCSDLTGKMFKMECVLPLNCELPDRRYISEKFEDRDVCKRDVCMTICQLLHEHGELDDEHLLPVKHKIDSDEDEEEDDGDRKVKEGTKKSRQIYQRKIPDVLSPDSFNLNECDLYAISMSLSSPYDRPGSIPHWALWYDESAKGFGIFLPKDIFKIHPFQLYTKAGEITIKLTKIPYSPTDLDEHLMQKFHQKIFTECSSKYTFGKLNFGTNQSNITKCLAVALKSKVFESIQRDQCIQLVNPIDLREMRRVLNSYYQTISNMKNQVIKKRYGDANLTKRSYYVVDVSSTMAGDVMEGSKKTYVDYYMEKYQETISPNIKLLDVVGSSMKVNYEEDNSYKESKKKKKSHRELLVGALCEQASQIPTDLHLRMQLLPHVLYRMECIINAIKLTNQISHAIGGTKQLSPKKLSRDNFLAYQVADTITKTNYLSLKRPVDKISSTATSSMMSSNDNDYSKVLFTLQQMLQGSKGMLPNELDVLQCLTTRQAKFGFDLERVEMLGDSFLKQAITVYLFFKHPNEHEGKLSIKRKNNISNKNLSRIAKRLGLQNIICNSHFCCTSQENQNRNPRTVWLPPLYTRYVGDHDVTMETEDNSDDEMSDIYLYPYQEVQDKSLADSVEALIGAYFNHGGVDGALNFMQNFLDLDVLFKAIENPDLQRVKESVSSKYADFPVVNPLLTEEIGKQMYERYKMDRFEKKLNYSFKEKSHLVRALTHLSYSSGTEIRGCYQEYEFLGDAILDFLVTLHVYINQPTLSPGDLTSLRSSLVNNNTFAILAIEYDFQKYLYHESPTLFSESQEFVSLVKDENEQEMDGCYDSPFIIIPRGSETGYHAPKVLGDLFESVAGAVFLDSGLDLVAVWKVFYPIMKPVLDKYMKTIPLNPARELQERFTDVKLEFTEFEQRMKCTVNIPGRDSVIGIGQNKKIAKSTAAKRALDKYL